MIFKIFFTLFLSCHAPHIYDNKLSTYTSVFILKFHTYYSQRIEFCLLNQPRLDAWDKRLDLVHWENLGGAGGEGGGRGDWDGEHM